MLGILFSLLPLVGWGVGDFVAGRLSRIAHPTAVSLVYGIVTGILTLIICIPFGLPDLDFRTIGGFLISSTLLTSGFLMMMQGFKHGPTGLVSPIANAYAVVTLLVSVMFFGGSIALGSAIGILVVVIGIAFLSYEKQQKTKSENNTAKAVVFSLLALLLFGVGFAIYEAVAIQQWYQNATISTFTGIFVATLMFLLWPRVQRKKDFMIVIKYKIAYISYVFNAAAFVGLFLAFENVTSVAIPAAIAAASPLVTMSLSTIFDKERLRKIQYFGGIITVLGIAVLSLSV